MSIEEEIFKNYEVNENNLIKYGFNKENGKFIYKQNIMNDKFTIIIEYDKKIKGKIIESEFNDEYINFRMETLGEFSSSIKEEFVNLLIDIRDKCFIKNVFKSLQTIRINEFIINKYGINPEFLWEKFPSYAIYRKTKKWFALIGNVSLNKIDKNSNLENEVELINIKVSEKEVDTILSKKGYYEAYHMNKRNWVSIILDDTLSDSEIEEMIINSYNIIIE